MQTLLILTALTTLTMKLRSRSRASVVTACQGWSLKFDGWFSVNVCLTLSQPAPTLSHTWEPITRALSMLRRCCITCWKICQLLSLHCETSVVRKKSHLMITSSWFLLILLKVKNLPRGALQSLKHTYNKHMGVSNIKYSNSTKTVKTFMFPECEISSHKNS